MFSFDIKTNHKRIIYCQGLDGHHSNVDLACNCNYHHHQTNPVCELCITLLWLPSFFNLQNLIFLRKTMDLIMFISIKVAVSKVHLESCHKITTQKFVNIRYATNILILYYIQHMLAICVLFVIKPEPFFDYGNNILLILIIWK